MKILTMSDSHGRFEIMHKIYKKEKPDYVFFQGDYTKDILELSYVEEESEYIIVKGNCDIEDYANPVRIEIEIEGYKFFITHGHHYNVKHTYEYLEKEAKQLKMDVAVFGHTHVPYFNKKDGVYLFNPGAVKDKNYGIIEIKDKDIKFELKFIEI